MATTAVAMLIDGGTGTLAHVGDSRAYRLRDGQLEGADPDRFLGGGTDPRRQRRHSQHRDPGAVGVGNLRGRPGGRWSRATACCSARMVSSQCSTMKISEVLRQETDLDSLCHALIQGANDGGGPDNVTAVVLQVDAV